MPAAEGLIEVRKGTLYFLFANSGRGNSGDLLANLSRFHTCPGPRLSAFHIFKFSKRLVLFLSCQWKNGFSVFQNLVRLYLKKLHKTGF